MVPVVRECQVVEGHQAIHSRPCRAVGEGRAADEGLAAAAARQIRPVCLVRGWDAEQSLIPDPESLINNQESANRVNRRILESGNRMPECLNREPELYSHADVRRRRTQNRIVPTTATTIVSRIASSDFGRITMTYTNPMNASIAGRG